MDPLAGFSSVVSIIDLTSRLISGEGLDSTDLSRRYLQDLELLKQILGDISRMFVGSPEPPSETARAALQACESRGNALELELTRRGWLQAQNSDFSRHPLKKLRWIGGGKVRKEAYEAFRDSVFLLRDVTTMYQSTSISLAFSHCCRSMASQIQQMQFEMLSRMTEMDHRVRQVSLQTQQHHLERSQWFGALDLSRR
jgi:hypothetical protein